MGLFVWNNRSVIHHSADPRNLYTPKQKSFSYLTKSSNITFEQSFIQAADRFDVFIGLRYLLIDFSVCVSLQQVSGSIGKIYLSQNKWEKSDLSKGLYIYDNHKIGGWGVLEIYHVFADSIVFKQLIYFSFCRQWRWGKKNWSFFGGCHKWMTPNLSD